MLLSIFLKVFLLCFQKMAMLWPIYPAFQAGVLFFPSAQVGNLVGTFHALPTEVDH
jgi:hypothetical protein